MLSTVQFEVMTTNLPVKTLDSVASSLSATLYQWNIDTNHKFLVTVSTKTYTLCWVNRKFTIGKLKSSQQPIGIDQGMNNI